MNLPRRETRRSRVFIDASIALVSYLVSRSNVHRLRISKAILNSITARLQENGNTEENEDTRFSSFLRYPIATGLVVSRSVVQSDRYASLL